MPSITFDLETVTPLFLSGADQTTAELRPPAFRGALRYWFRAIAASIASEDVVRTWEDKVFGNTDSSGAVTIRVQAKKPISNRVPKKDQDFPGLIYLFFLTYGDNKRDPRGCFPPGSHFKVILQTRLNRQEDQQCLKLAIGAMWLLIHLGGLGSRSNRGGGNLKVKSQPQPLDLGLGFKIQATDIRSLSEELSQGIRLVKELYREIIPSNQAIQVTTPTRFDILHPQTSNIYLWQSGDAENNDYWDTLLDDFGIHYQNFRSRYKDAQHHDYKEIKEWLRTNGGSSIATVKRAAFGLPIQFRFRSLSNKSAFVEATSKINRSASPMHIKVIELSNNKKLVLIICFKSSLLPSNEKLLVKSKSASKPVVVTAPNQGIINQEFIPSLNTTIVNLP
ncbi:type III-B CRISPR module RAMP protein Cmr1 [Trichothermofontia sp.]